MQQVLLVEFQIAAQHVAAFAAAINANAAASLAQEPGCRLFDVCRSAEEPGLFVLYEIYDNEAAVQAHLVSPHFQQMNTATASWVERKTVRRLQLGRP